MKSIVIPVKRDTKNSNIELIYALRSLEENLTGISEVFIIGEKIMSLRGLKYIKCKDDIPSKFKERNIYRKIMEAVLHVDVTEDFIFSNDDIYLLDKFDANDLPYLHKGTLDETMARNTGDYRKSLNHSKKLLMSRGKTTMDFDTHFPVSYNKTDFINTFVCKDVNWDQPFGYVIKSIYANSLNIEGEFGGDCKVQTKLKYEEIQQKVSGKRFFSTSDGCLNKDMLDFLQDTFPNKSSFEK